MQQHGFARNLEWSISSTSADAQPDDLDPSVELVLLPNEYTRAMWDYDFKAVYSVTLHGETLKTDFRSVSGVFAMAGMLVMSPRKLLIFNMKEYQL